MNGEVIGVNTAIYTQSAGYQGIGFAMPSNTVVEVYNDLISPSHKVTRGSIGIQFREGLSGAVNRVYGFKNGVLVQQVQPGGPADKAGLKPGDIITTIDGRAIKDGDDLVNEIASRRPGSTVRLGYLRDGKPAGHHRDHRRPRQGLCRPGQPAGRSRAPTSSGDAGEAKLGIVVREASPATAAKLHTAGVVDPVGPHRLLRRPAGAGAGPGHHPHQQAAHPEPEQFDAVVSKLKTGDDVVFEVIDPRHPELGINYIGGTL